MTLPTTTREVGPEAGTAGPVYLDCSATTPVDARVQAEVMHYLADEYGNAGSRTHEFGQRAKERVQQARTQVGNVVDAQADEVVFTSGATESNNLALLGLAGHGEEIGHRHVISSGSEHKAVLEPLEELQRRGFEVTLLPPTAGGWVDPDAVADALRPDTLLVSVMQANNETGIIQPLDEIAEVLTAHDAYLHVDAAQGFGKDLPALRRHRIDLISISGHKIYGPKGVGALITRRRGYRRPPLQALLHGGGQEHGLRPGTLAVPLVAGLGTASELALTEHDSRAAACRGYRGRVLAGLAPLDPLINGDQESSLPHVVNLTFPGLDAEAVMLALRGLVAISNGSACTSHRFEPSHVLSAMGLPEPRIRGALRVSWCHATPEVDWDAVVARLRGLR